MFRNIYFKPVFCCQGIPQGPFSPNSVHTVGFLAVILILADLRSSDFRVYSNQLLCAGCGDRACRLSPVHAKRLRALIFAERLNRFSTLCFSVQEVLQMTPGRSRGAKLSASRLPEGLLQDPSSQILTP